MIRLPSIPKDETYNLKKRAIELLQKWTSILGGDGGAEGATEGNIEATAAASTNADAGNTSETIEKKSEVPAEAPATTNGQDEVKAITGSEHKVNGTTEKEAQEIKGEASKSAESATTSNGIEKSAHPESQSATTSETAKGEEKLVETAEASS